MARCKVYLSCDGELAAEFKAEIWKYNPDHAFVDSAGKADRIVLQSNRQDVAHGLYFRFPAKRPIMLIEKQTTGVFTFRFVPKD